MTITTHPESLTPRVHTPSWPIRRVTAIAFATAGSVLALALGLQLLFASTPAACGADCVRTLSGHRFASVLGVSAIAWATALHGVLVLATWAVVLAPVRRRALFEAAQLGLIVVLLGGSATYLVLGLATDVSCNVCLTLHALALIASLGVALLPREPAAVPRHHRIAAVVLALALWVGLAWGLARWQTRTQLARAAPMASTEKWLAAVCQPGTCPSAARLPSHAMPDADAALVLGAGAGPTLVAWIDLECAACRADFKSAEPLFRRLMQARRGLRLVLRAGSRACDAQAAGADARACEAPAAAICAARHVGPEAALDLITWELAAEPGYYTLADRKAALAAMSPLAARCLDQELALGPRGTLAAHAEAGRRLAFQAESRPGCSGPSPAWWCFAATPSFAIIDPTSAPHHPVVGDSSAFASATGELRREVLEQCLESSP